MNRIAILTDSTANMPQEWIDEFGIRTIPLKVQIDNETFRDGVDLTPTEFYRRLPHTKTLPTTSQPSIHDFLQAFESLADQAECILVPLISSGISGTVASAQAAASQFTRVPVEIIDTHITAMGQVLILNAIGRAVQQGKTVAEIKLIADRIIRDLHVYFAVDNLEYLHRGGRINTATRYLGTALAIKPILTFNPEGKIEAKERVRTNRKALERLISLSEEYAQGRPAHIGIVHADAEQTGQEFYEQVKQRLDCREIFLIELSPVVGTHVGPGTIGIALYADER